MSGNAPMPGLDHSKIDFCIDNLDLNYGGGRIIPDEARAEVKATFESHQELLAALTLAEDLLAHDITAGQDDLEIVRAAIAHARGVT